MTTQQATRGPTRLLLPAAFTIAAGFGVALAFSDDAYAAGTEPHTNDVTTITATVDGTLHGLAATTADPVRQITSTVKQVTDVVDETTAPLPVIGETVDRATDLTDAILDTAPAILNPPATPDDGSQVNEPNPAGGGSDIPSAAVPPAAPQTAPEPAREQPPRDSSTDPGAPTLLHPGPFPTGPRWQIPSTPENLKPTWPHLPGSIIWGACDLNETTAGCSSHTQPYATTNRWKPPLHLHRVVTTHIADRDGRTEPPSPPSG